jgi:hypothetical protein
MRKVSSSSSPCGSKGLAYSFTIPKRSCSFWFYYDYFFEELPPIRSNYYHI